MGRNAKTVAGKLRLTLDEAVAKSPDCSVIISTEAKAHMPYLFWAIDKDLDILMDKPISAPIGAGTNITAARQIFEDYLAIAARLEKSKSNVIVQCQRRSHPGYQLVNTYLSDFLQDYQIPISYIDIYHADGMWCMPPELFQRENHPYKYGYGKLMHSGYHFIDLLAWLLNLNLLVTHKKPTVMDLFVKCFKGYDFLHQISAADYQKLFNTDQFKPFFKPAMKQQAKTLGEIDTSILCQLKRQDVVITTATLNLQQNSFSRRAWIDLPADVYKGNGRVRHERLNIQVANLLNIQVHSYQSYEVGKKDVETTGAGHEDHFDVYIFRNSELIGGKTLEKYAIGEMARCRHQSSSCYLGHNETAREANFLDFLTGPARVPLT